MAGNFNILTTTKNIVVFVIFAKFDSAKLRKCGPKSATSKI